MHFISRLAKFDVWHGENVCINLETCGKSVLNIWGSMWAVRNRRNYLSSRYTLTRFCCSRECNPHLNAATSPTICTDTLQSESTCFAWVNCQLWIWPKCCTTLFALADVAPNTQVPATENVETAAVLQLSWVWNSFKWRLLCIASAHNRPPSIQIFVCFISLQLQAPDSDLPAQPSPAQTGSPDSAPHAVV